MSLFIFCQLFVYKFTFLAKFPWNDLYNHFDEKFNFGKRFILQTHKKVGVWSGFWNLIFFWGQKIYGNSNNSSKESVSDGAVWSLMLSAPIPNFSCIFQCYQLLKSKIAKLRKKRPIWQFAFRNSLKTSNLIVTKT